MERIEIVLASDEKYYDGLLVTAGSIAIYASRSVILSFSIADGGIPDVSFEYLTCRLLSLHPHVEIKRFKIDDSLFADFPSWHGNKMAYARFLFPQLLPNVKHAIYSDDDILWLADVSKLWIQRDMSKIVQACRDIEINQTKEPAWFARNGFNFPREDYFCAGMMIMNLDLFRRHAIVHKLYTFLYTHPDCLFADQSALNVIASGYVGILDSKWMCFTRSTKCIDIRHPIVLHYTNNIPWRDYGWLEDVRSSRVLWYQLNAKIRGISTWASFRMFNGLLRTLRICLLNFIFKFSVTRFFVILLFHMSGRTWHIKFLRDHVERIYV